MLLTCLKVVVAFVLIASLGSAPVSARQINITYFDNCQDATIEPVVFLTDIDYHIVEDGTCDIVHGNVVVLTEDTEPLQLYMTLFKCEELHRENLCLDNPSEHQELLDCDRLMNDDSGPWHMVTSAMDSGQCGDEVGTFSMTFARLRLEHLIKYLDVYDKTYNSFRLKMEFVSTKTKQTRGCGELDFKLLAI